MSVHSSRAAEPWADQVEERLTAEARLDRHQQHHVELGEQVLVGLDGRRRPQRHAGPGTVAAQLAGEPHRGRLASTWKVTERAPASTYAIASRSGASIIRWASSGTSVARASASTIVGPNVRLGTKWLSITSTCTQSALGIRATSAPSEAKSAFRMLGVICGVMRGATPRILGGVVRRRWGGRALGGVAVGPLQQRRDVEDVAVDALVQVAQLGEPLRDGEDREVARVAVGDLVQRTGVETRASGRPRTEYAAAMVWSRVFWL